MDLEIKFIRDVLNKNYELKKEISRLEKANAETISETESIQMPIKKVEEVIEEKIVEDTIGDETEFYFSEIMKYKLTGSIVDDLDNLRELMPSKESGYYKKVFLRILANINAEINEYRGEIERLKSECTDEELLEYYEEIKLLEAKIKYLRTIDKEKEIPLEQRKKNSIIFMPKSGDKVYAFDDLVSIPLDYYDAFKELFDSIVNGTFKNVRYFKSINNKMSGIAEVKGFKVRILFDRLSSHTYACIACFVKKSDNDKDYREFVANRIATYRVKKQAMLEQIKDEQYLEENKELLEIINEMFDSKEIPSLNGRGIK